MKRDINDNNAEAINGVNKFNPGMKGIKFLKVNSQFFIFYAAMCKYFETHYLPFEVKLFEDNSNNIFMLNNKFYFPDGFIKLFNPEVGNITILPHQKGVDLYRLELYNTGGGLGTELMKAFSAISIETGIPVFLVPGTPGFSTQTDLKRLEKFYLRMGFRPIMRSMYWTNSSINGYIRPVNS